MSDSRWYGGPKKPAPAHGIKMKKAGTTWWGQKWIAALELVLRGDSGRLARGRTYARAGRTHDLIVQQGEVTAKVTGSRSTPYEISLQIAQLPAAAWTRAIEGMAAKAQFTAELLAGHMPKDIDEVFRAAEASLFPVRGTDLKTSCSCPDWGDPCKHVAAAHYVLGEAFDRDPFLLFELRGRTKAQVLEALRAARGGDEPIAPEAEPEIPRVSLAAIDTSNYDKPRADLPALHFSFEPEGQHGALLKQLGVPQTWSAETSPAESFAPLVRAAAEAARHIALAENEPPPTEPEPPAPPRRLKKPRRKPRR